LNIQALNKMSLPRRSLTQASALGAQAGFGGLLSPVSLHGAPAWPIEAKGQI
jgi:hypothetical protein